MGIEKVIGSYRKALELIKDGIGYVDTGSEHGRRFIKEAQDMLGALVENLPNVQEMYEEMEEKFEVEKDCKNDAYLFILESGNFYRYRRWHFRLQTMLEKFWDNSLKAPKGKKGRKQGSKTV